MAVKGLIAKRGKAIFAFPFFLLLIFMTTNTVFASTFFVGAKSHSPGVLTLTLEGVSPYQVYKSSNNIDFDFFTDWPTDTYTEYGLSNGETYYYKFIDSTGAESIIRYTTPYTNVTITPLEVIQLGDNYCQLKWSETFGEVYLYKNGTYIGTYTENSVTMTDLIPDTDYRFHIVMRSGFVSNTVKITTTNIYASLYDRLDSLLKSIFVPNNNIDTDGDGIPDPYDELYSAWQALSNYRPISMGNDVKTAFDNVSQNFNNGTNLGLPKLEVDFLVGPGQIIYNVFDLDEFADEIEIIRKLLSATLWIGLFLYFVQAVVPRFKI